MGWFLNEREGMEQNKIRITESFVIVFMFSFTPFSQRNFLFNSCRLFIRFHSNFHIVSFMFWHDNHNIDFLFNLNDFILGFFLDASNLELNLGLLVLVLRNFTDCFDN